MGSAGVAHLKGYHAIISCEGTAEQVAVEKLVEAERLVFPLAIIHEGEWSRWHKSRKKPSDFF